MTPQQSSAIAETWQQWEGRVVTGRYPLGQYLGGSEHSAVYLTTTAGAKSVIKLITADAQDAQKQLSRWELASRLSHPNLIRIIEVGRWHADDEQDMLFAVMEYADESLSETLPGRRLTVGEARQMLAPTLDALRYLHAQGLVHGRIRPSNVMAIGDQLKLSSDSVSRMGKGTAQALIPDSYDAPEVAKGVLAPSGDLWSLGVMLAEVLTGRLPIFSETANEVRLPEKLPQPYEDIVKHCLDRDPEKRWSAAEVKKRLDRPEIETPKSAAEPVKPAEPQPTTFEEAEAIHLASLRRKANGVGAQASATPVRPARTSATETTAAEPRSKRMLWLVAIGCVALLLILIGVVRRGKPSPTPATTTAVVTPAEAPSAAPPPAREATAKPSGTQDAAVLHQVLPTIPSKARNSINGTVKVRVKVSVDPSGKVSHASLVSRGPSGYFARQALEAARQWSFAPPQIHGQAAGSEWALTFEFRRSGTKTAAQRVS